MKIASVVGFGIRASTLIGLIAHFAMTLLFVSPSNPIKMDYGAVANATIGTYFPQNWSLFAPTPVQSTQSLLVHCLTEEELPKSSADRLPSDDWHDVSLAHFAQAQQHRISAYERLVRPIQNAMRTYLYGGPDLVPFHEACGKGDAEACKFREEMMKPRQQSAVRMLRSIGSAFCRETSSRGRFAGVALRLRERGSVPWSERRTGAPKMTDYELGSFPIDEAVALPGLYSVESSR